jgi:hypothetical protein
MHTNADLLKLKTKKGIFFSEALFLIAAFGFMNRTNYREFGNKDQREKYTPDQIKKFKKEGNSGFANKTVVKFW